MSTKAYRPKNGDRVWVLDRVNIDGEITTSHIKGTVDDSYDSIWAGGVGGRHWSIRMDDGGRRWLLDDRSWFWPLSALDLLAEVLDVPSNRGR